MIEQGADPDVRVEDRILDHNGRPVVVILVLGGSGLGPAAIAALASKCIDQVAIDYPSPEPVTVVATQDGELADLGLLAEVVSDSCGYQIRPTEAPIEIRRRRVSMMEHYAHMDAMAMDCLDAPISQYREPPERPWLDRPTRRRDYGRGAPRLCTTRTAGRDKSFGRGSWR